LAALLGSPGELANNATAGWARLARAAASNGHRSGAATRPALRLTGYIVDHAPGEQRSEIGPAATCNETDLQFEFNVLNLNLVAPSRTALIIW
jgi:hypothetical protein